MLTVLGETRSKPRYVMGRHPFMTCSCDGWCSTNLADLDAYRKDFYLIGSNPVDGIPRWKPHGLPQTTRTDGRHVWEPPNLSYSALIGDQYEKKREAVLKYTKQDVVRATKILDELTDFLSISKYLFWAYGEVEDAKRVNDCERMSFLAGLCEELCTDSDDTIRAAEGGSLINFRMQRDGTLTVVLDGPIVEDYAEWESEEEEREDEDAADTSASAQFLSATGQIETFSRLAALGLEDYASDQSDEVGDDGASLALSDSAVYLDAHSTIFEQSEDGCKPEAFEESNGSVT